MGRPSRMRTSVRGPGTALEDAGKTIWGGGQHGGPCGAFKKKLSAS